MAWLCKHQFKWIIHIFSVVVHHAAQIYRPIFVVLFMWSLLTICLTMLLIQMEIVECGVLNKYTIQCVPCAAILYYMSRLILSTLQKYIIISTYEWSTCARWQQISRSNVQKYLTSGTSSIRNFQTIASFSLCSNS